MDRIDISISLPPGLKQYMDARVLADDYPDASTYIGDLIRAEREHHPETSFELSLIQGLQSGPAAKITDWECFKNDILRGANLSASPTTSIE